MLELYIGNKNYSSWSLRAWLLLKHLDLPSSSTGFRWPDATTTRLSNPGRQCRVPCLHVDGFQIWESLAIAEYLAESQPALWPADAQCAGAGAAIAAEMHAGFTNLPAPCP